MSSFLSKIKSASEKVDALTSGIFDAANTIDEALLTAQQFADQGVQFLSQDFVTALAQGAIGELALTAEDKIAASVDQGLVNLFIDPTQVAITQTPDSPTIDQPPPGTVTQPAPTQPTDVFVDRIGPEPPRDFRGQYPYVHTEKSLSGHVNEVDDTPGAERLFRFHRSGTYEEVNATGRRVVKVAGTNYTIIAYDDFVHIEGSAQVHVKGNIQINCYNDAKINVAGRTELNSGEDIRIKGKSISLESHTGDINIYSAKGLNMHSTANTEMTVQGAWNATATEDVNITSSMDMGFSSNTNLYIRATANVGITSYIDSNFAAYGKLVMSADDIASIKAKNNVNIDGAEIHMAEGLAKTAPGAPETLVATDAKKSGLGTAPDREDAAVTDAVEEAVMGLDDDAEQSAKAIDDLVSSGRITQDEAEALKKGDTSPALETDTSAPPSNLSVKSLSAGDIEKLPESSINNSLKLSPNYVLGQLTTNFPAAGQHPLKAQNGLSKARLAANLSLLCQNCIEPIRAKYGDQMKINSAFRSGSGTSQHNKGMAADLTYSAYSKNPDKVIEIAKWIKDNIVFDQLILEYGNNQIWTHISFDPTKGSKQRRDVRTCRNPANPVYEHGLIRYKAKWE